MHVRGFESSIFLGFNLKAIQMYGKLTEVPSFASLFLDFLVVYGLSVCGEFIG